MMLVNAVGARTDDLRLESEISSEPLLGKSSAPTARPPASGASGASITLWRYERLVVLFILLSVCVRMVCAASMPLATDEVLYWRYSTHLAPGFLDHPAMNPVLIRLGTMLFGNTPLGVRFFAVLLGLPASWAVWRSAAILLRDERAGASAALFFNLTLVMTMGSLLATSDASVVATSAFLLYGLAKLNETGRGAWWLAIGAAFGLGMLAKYTTLFFAVGMFVWLLAVPQQRKWFSSFWPYAGGLIALLVFSPALLWNAQHHWASLVYQSSRMVVHNWSARWAFELIGSQIGLATPPIFILACIGLVWGFRDGDARRRWAILLCALIAPLLLYFLWHSLHERVQGNWLECIFPVVMCAAAGAVHFRDERTGALAGWARWSERLAVPFGVSVAVLIYAQSIFGILPLGRKDPTSRLLGYGWSELGASIDAARAQAGAPVIVTTDYSLASALAYYLPSHAAVEQIGDRIRWVNEPAPDPHLFTGSMLYVCKNACPHVVQLPERFRRVEFLRTFPRMRRGVVIERYSIYRLAEPTEAVLDPLYPIRLKGTDDDSL